jgi:transcriptional regulator with XRE-family HTH domain
VREQVANRTSGLDLKLERVKAGISQRDLAAEMEVSPNRVYFIESSRTVTAAAARNYLAALQRITRAA